MSSTDPFQLFADWFAEARESEPNDPDAMALATSTPDGRPSVRMVLLKGHGPDGFTFYTNLDSRKGAELAANGHAALLFHWKSLRRQVRVEGPIDSVPDQVANEYFATRSRDRNWVPGRPISHARSTSEPRSSAASRK
jgi:pyridoxamine 5'-phosphate oxidase